MRMINGNKLTITFLNCDGLMTKERQTAIGALDSDIIALTETHLNNDSIQLASGFFTEYDAHWGAPVIGKNDGVGFLIKKKTLWHTNVMQWYDSSPCRAHFNAGRLHGMSIFTGNGKQQILMYIIYGVSGARWSLDLKRQTHHIVESVLADAASRGLPAILGGDFNLEISDSTFLQSMPQIGWTNLAEFSHQATTPTCFRGKNGSVIDFIWANSLMMASFSDFSVSSHDLFADHAPLQCSFNESIRAQDVLRNRDYGDTPEGFLG